MSRTAAGAAIRERALALPKGEGEGAKPVSLVQRKDASALGTNVDGMSRSQAAAAISAHKGWYNQGVANAKWQPQSNAHPYASDNRPTPAHMRPKDSAAGGSATPESAATTEKYHNLSNGASPDPNRNAPYTTDWKERNPQEAQEVTHRLGQLKAGTWTQPQNAQEAAVRDARLKSNK